MAERPIDYGDQPEERRFPARSRAPANLSAKNTIGLQVSKNSCKQVSKTSCFWFQWTKRVYKKGMWCKYWRKCRTSSVSTG